jgi:hypothetical protein
LSATRWGWPGQCYSARGGLAPKNAFRVQRQRRKSRRRRRRWRNGERSRCGRAAVSREDGDCS